MRIFGPPILREDRANFASRNGSSNHAIGSRSPHTQSLIVSISARAGRNHYQRRVLGKLGNVAKELFRSKPVFYGECGHDLLARIEMPAPEIISNLVQNIALIRDELRIEKRAAFKCPISQHPLSETMDRVNGSTVETLQGD